MQSGERGFKPPSLKARINSSSHNDSHSSYSQRQEVSRVTLISAAGRNWEQYSTAMVMNHFPFPRRSFARGRCCCRKMPATNLIFHLNHIPSHDENRDTAWPIISQIILLPVSILCEIYAGTWQAHTFRLLWPGRERIKRPSSGLLLHEA